MPRNALWWLCFCDKQEIISHGRNVVGVCREDRGPRKEQHGQTWDINATPSAEELPRLLADWNNSNVQTVLPALQKADDRVDAMPSFAWDVAALLYLLTAYIQIKQRL